jgi:hypothetical protein
LHCRGPASAASASTDRKSTSFGRPRPWDAKMSFRVRHSSGTADLFRVKSSWLKCYI